MIDIYTLIKDEQINTLAKCKHWTEDQVAIIALGVRDCSLNHYIANNKTTYSNFTQILGTYRNQLTIKGVIFYANINVLYCPIKVICWLEKFRYKIPQEFKDSVIVYKEYKDENTLLKAEIEKLKQENLELKQTSSSAERPYTTYDLDLMQRCINDLKITSKNQPLAKKIVSHLLDLAKADKQELSKNLAASMATIIRLKENRKGGLKKVL